MDKRLELHKMLVDILGSENVYFNPPASIFMKYDAIRYSLRNYYTRKADNTLYNKMDCYEVVVIAKQPGHPAIDKLLRVPYCSHDRHYVADNLSHDVFTLYN